MKWIRLDNEKSRHYLANLVATTPFDRDLEFTWRKHSEKRTDRMNALSHVAYRTIAEQLDGYTQEQARCECKLRFGVPIMRLDDEYRRAYDEVIKPHTYERKLELMRLWPVTRLMTVEQMADYLEQVMAEYGGQGVVFGD